MIKRRTRGPQVPLALGNRESRAHPTITPAGIVFDIQRGALRDGPGIRTTIFLKGCPLRCLWCHNPESQRFAPETGKSGKTYGERMSVEEVMIEVRRDRPYYATSGGGLTLSGGEPTAQFEFCRALLEAARAEGIHTCLDTCGHCPPEKFRELLPLVDLFLFDYKATGDDLHYSLTTQHPAWIRANLQTLHETGAAVQLRCPLVPDVNDSDEHIAAIAQLAHRLPGLNGVDFLPFHQWGEEKARDLDRELPLVAMRKPTDADLARWTSLAAANQLAVTLG